MRRLSRSEASQATFGDFSGADCARERRRTAIAEDEKELYDFAPRSTGPRIPIGLPQAEFTAQASAYFRTHGLVRLDGLLSAVEAKRLAVHVDLLLSTACKQVCSSQSAFLDLFGPIMSRANRYDLLLPLDSVVLPAAKNVLQRVGATLQEIVGDCHLCELTALVSDSGAAAQPVHHDTSFDGTPPRVSLLVALQDITDDMGPTIWFPATNTPAWHLKYSARGDDLEDLLGESTHIRGLLGIGDAVLYDTRLLHCGGANTQQRRALLTLSMQLEDSSSQEMHANIKRGYRSRLRIRDAPHWSEMA